MPRAIARPTRRFRPSLPLIPRLFVLIALVGTALEVRVLCAYGETVRAVVALLWSLLRRIVCWAAAPEIAEKLRDLGRRR